MKRLTKRAGIVAIALLLTACGGVFTVLRAAIAASTPYVNRLVRDGKITQAKADAIKKDFTDIVNASEAWDRLLKAATTTVERAKAFQSVANDYAAIIARKTFANIPWLDEAVGIMNDIFDSIGMFYGSKAGPPRAGQPRTEAELKAYVDERSRRLKASFK